MRTYWYAYTDNEVIGRCVRIGQESPVPPARRYHWAITHAGGILRVDEFWDTEIWTTARYRAERQ